MYESIETHELNIIFIMCTVSTYIQRDLCYITNTYRVPPFDFKTYE